VLYSLPTRIPTTLPLAVRQFGAGKPVKFNLVKAAHHSSAGNNTSALLKMLNGQLWLISTDGTRNSHPDPEAIARILLNGGECERLVFNYWTVYADWADVTLQAKYRYSATYAEDARPYSIDLLAPS
jgi:hypothetical protein